MSGLGRQRLVAGVIGLSAAICLAGCGGTADPSSNKSADSASPAQPVSSTATVDPNIVNCGKVNDTMLKVREAFDAWDIDNNMFDHAVAAKIRRQATALYGLEGKATGPARRAIHNEAASLVDLSIAMQAEDVVAVGEASEASNRALAALRGTCNF